MNKIYVYAISMVLYAHTSIALDGSVSKESIGEKYAGINILTMTATAQEGTNRFVYTVRSDGAFSYVQFNKDMYSNIYREHRDVSEEWDMYPAYYSYYDGGKSVLVSATFDPTGMYETTRLDNPLDIGQAIQTKGCVWPILPALIEEGEFVAQEDGGLMLLVESLSTSIYFDDRNLVREVVWRDVGSRDGAVGRWKFSGYSESPNTIFPTQMIHTYGVEFENQSSSGSIKSHIHQNLEFDRDQNRAEKRLQFVPPAGEHYRKDSRASDVFDSDGTLLYNQDEMAAEYFAALGKGKPKRNRWVLLSVLGVVVVGSVWVLRKRVA